MTPDELEQLRYRWEAAAEEYLAIDRRLDEAYLALKDARRAYLAGVEEASK